MVWLDGAIIALLAFLVVLELLRPYRVRKLLDEADERSRTAVAAMDRAQEQLQSRIEELARLEERDEARANRPAAEDRPRSAPAGEETHRERSGRDAEPGAGVARQVAARAYQQALNQSVEEAEDAAPAAGAWEEPQARDLREKIAHLVEHSGGKGRSQREQHLLEELEETLRLPDGAARRSREQALFQALQEAADTGEGPDSSGPTEEERELIAKLRERSGRG